MVWSRQPCHNSGVCCERDVAGQCACALQWTWHQLCRDCGSVPEYQSDFDSNGLHCYEYSILTMV